MRLYRECFQHLYELERRRIPPTPDGDLRLHRLERPESWTQDLIDEIAETQPEFNLYPDYAAFINRLCTHIGMGVGPSNVVVGAGSEDLIRNLVMLCCDPGDGFAYTWPSCKMFDIYAEVFSCDPIKICPNPDDHPAVTDYTNILGEGNVKLLLIPNPGQPVETYLTPDDFRVIAGVAKETGTVLCVDEAYYGFGAHSALPLIEEFNNVVVLRTFSKAFGAAGLRVGWAMGHRRVIHPLNAVRQSGEIAGPSMHAAWCILDHWPDKIVPGIMQVCNGRDWLRTELRLAGYTAIGKMANHVSIDMGTAVHAKMVARELADRGVHVRTNEGPADRFLMVTCGSRQLMKLFLEIFLEVA